MRGGSSQGEVGVLEKGSVECAQERGKGFEVKEENAIGEGMAGWDGMNCQLRATITMVKDGMNYQLRATMITVNIVRW